MSTDLIERLRDTPWLENAAQAREAADALEDLTRENERLRAHAEFYREAMREANATAHAENERLRDALQAARSLLAEEGEEVAAMERQVAAVRALLPPDDVVSTLGSRHYLRVIDVGAALDIA